MAIKPECTCMNGKKALEKLSKRLMRKALYCQRESNRDDTLRFVADGIRLSVDAIDAALGAQGANRATR